MSFKTKTLGLAAATALSLTMVTGVMADGTTTVNLADGGAACGASVSGAANFGSYTWNGSSYDFQTGSDSNSVSLSVTGGTRWADSGNCTVTVDVSDMVGTNDINNTISKDAISLDDGSGNTSPFTFSAGNHDLTASFTVANGFAPDAYNGDITVGDVSGS